MTQCSSVVPETSGVTEQEFRAAMLSGLARCAKGGRDKILAFAMDITTKQLGNIFDKGATPGAKRLWDARSACPSALDDIAKLYGVRIVPATAITTREAGTLPLAALLARVAQAENPESPGGAAKTHRELLDMESDVRTVRRLLDGWIEEIDAVRRPRAVS